MERQFKFIHKNKNKILFAFLTIYLIGNMLFLTKFPFVHSDEPWLSGLSRNILENRDYSVTETFFNLYERNPHAIKSLFHTIQIVFIKLFGYSIFSVRLVSLLFSVLTLCFFYKLCLKIFTNTSYALTAVILLALDIQYIYASHFARQEIILTFIFVYILYYLFKNLPTFNVKNSIVIGLILGLSIGIHPNSFIIALSIASIVLYHMVFTKNIGLKEAIICFITITFLAIFFIILSLQFDPNFFTNYSNYGQQFGVFYSPDKKISQIFNFYLKLYLGISGTYYTPNIKLQYILFITTFIISILKLIKQGKAYNKNIVSIILSIIAINIGLIIIGRYNQTSIIFLFPLFYILTIYAITSLPSVYKRACVCILVITLFLSSAYAILPYLSNHYDSYIDEIATVISSDSVVLANLNTEYYFENGKLYDYRNLAFLKSQNLSFSEYIKEHNIEYIIYPSEMDYIYDTRPLWNGLYGNTYYYYSDMTNFFDENCTLEYTFTDKMYGNRIARYINKKEWTIKIYRVNE